jgi:hypothetical protein
VSCMYILAARGVARQYELKNQITEFVVLPDGHGSEESPCRCCIESLDCLFEPTE